MYYNRKKEWIKSGIIIAGILLIAILSTHYIYYKFKDERNIDYNSKSLDIIFHEKDGAQITLQKITPVTDAVGLSSQAYTLTIKNNLTEPVQYQIKLVDDTNAIKIDDCKEYQIPKNLLRVAIKENNKENSIYTLSELEEGVLIYDKVKALEEADYTIRVWTSNGSSLPNGTNLHYHGIIQVIEDDMNN